MTKLSKNVAGHPGLLWVATSVFINPKGLITRINLGPMTGGQMDEYIGEIVE